MLEMAIFGMIASYILGIFVGRNWKRFTTE